MELLKKFMFLGSCLLLSFTSLSSEFNESSNQLLMKEGGKGVKASMQKNSVLKSKSLLLDSVNLAIKKTSSLAVKKSPSLALPKINNKLVSPVPSSKE